MPQIKLLCLGVNMESQLNLKNKNTEDPQNMMWTASFPQYVGS